MNPLRTAETIEQTLRDYVRRTLPLERSLPELTEAVESFFHENPLARPPYLELMSGYQTGASLAELADEGVIYPDTARIFADAYLEPGASPGDFRVYRHQEEAIRSVCAERKNLVVCSGTGSGKTECFLIPLVNYLVGQWIEAGKPNRLPPGVHVMILYPMNALVNDQIRRLRTIMQHAEFLTFGKYTGELAQIRDETSVQGSALENLDQHQKSLWNLAEDTEWSGLGFDDANPIRNEITRRSEWRKAPGHVLVTNYSMLERLLLQPENSSLFENPWKYVILDESHVYDGALGTEIAWLMRRVKKRMGNPAELQFMATSATLIDDSELSPEEKARRIREDFASQLFPASPESFSVQFGSPLPFVPMEDAFTGSRPLSYHELTQHELTLGEIEELYTFEQVLAEEVFTEEQKLFSLTQRLLGLETWLNQLDATMRQIPSRSEHAMAAGDVLHVLLQADSLHTSRMFDCKLDAACNLVEGDTALQSLQSILRLMKDMVGDWSDWDKWREYLHDYQDPRPSSVPNDTYQQNGRVHQRPYGNRLHLLQEWMDVEQGQLSTLGLEAFTYLLKTAENLVTELETITGETLPSPLQLPMQLSGVALNALITLKDNHRKALSTLGTWRGLMNQHWSKVLGVSGADFETMLARYLGGAGGDAERLAHHALHALEQKGERAESATFSACAAEVFGKENPEAEQELDALVSLGILARNPSTRKPVLDIRYHQLMRGVSDVGVSFCEGDQIRLHPSEAQETTWEAQPRAVFPMAVCRECGQPFLFGYSDSQQLNPGVGIQALIRTATERSNYLHAFAWKPGNRPEEAETAPRDPNSNCWFHIGDGRVCVGMVPETPLQDPLWRQAYWYCSSNSPGRGSFIPECPCCRATSSATHAEFGIITPYEAKGQQFKQVMLDTLIRHVDPSNLPQVRRHPGEGRKVLAFSDSRKGAATLAFQYQEWYNDSNVVRLLPEASDHREQLTKPYLEYARQEKFVHDNLEEEALDEGIPVKDLPQDTVEKFVKRYVNRNPLQSAGTGLRVAMEQSSLDRLLEVSDETGEDLTKTDAAIFRMLQAIRKQGRYSALKRGIVQVASIALDEHHKTKSPCWSNAVNLLGEEEALLTLCRDLHRCLLGRAKMTLPTGWPSDGINTGWHREVCRENSQGQSFHRFVTSNKLSTINKLVRQYFPKATPEQARDVLDTIWPIFTSGGKSKILESTGTTGYRLNVEDLKLRFQMEVDPDSEEEDDPSWQYDLYLASRKVIPVRIEEHTAQLAKEKSSAYQKAFSDGRVNILSCSTTFEMGVDLGDLSCVFLANLPPGVANYRQRAGRAGRRPGSAAYVVSFVGFTPHERYYFDHTPELIFGDVQAPRIYLDNPLFRARHLRAEALHDFLSWMGKDHNGTTRWKTLPYWHHSKQNPGNLHRSWQMAGHFFVGRNAAWLRDPASQKRKPKLVSTFKPVVHEITQWRESRRQDFQTYALNIDDIPSDLNYNVADDLIWQVLDQTDQTPVAPYALARAGHHTEYKHLAGANQPESDPGTGELRLSDESYKRDVETRILRLYKGLYDADAGGDPCDQRPRNEVIPTGIQLHTLHESTIDWLTRCRVLPKYGFPVDVIRLLPHPGDVHSRNVDMERDLKIGLYEYAPGQIVMADKRVYPSAFAVVFAKKDLAAEITSAPTFYLCSSCHQPHKTLGQKCSACGSSIDLMAMHVIRPDAFRANLSRAGNANVSAAPSSRIQVFTGGITNQHSVPDTRMVTAESLTGEIDYFNFGQSYNGFNHKGSPYSLRHTIRTDIAVWLPDATLFDPSWNSWLYRLQQSGHLARAMQSALEAILRAAALVLGIVEREIAGITYPHKDQRYSFVLFDDSSGGGGAVLPLVLSGNANLDNDRISKIRDILERALCLCEECPECNKISPIENIDVNLRPVPREIWIAEGKPALSRPAQCCYHCLRSYGNQRFELDRMDAALVLREIIGV